MTPIQINIKAGSNAGRRLLLEQSPITLGRSPDNTVMLDLPFVSRLHAELRFEDGHWSLVNHSPNGTRLGRRWVTDQPAALDSAASIQIGEEAVLDVTPQAAPAGAAESTGSSASEASAPAGTGMSKRSKVWIGIGVYLVAMLVLFIVLATLTGGENDGDAGPRIAELSRSDIAQEIERRPAPEPPDERRARAALTEARELFNRRDSERDGRYRALEAYRIAIKYMPDHELPENVDRRKYHVLQQELIDQVAEHYQRAYNLLRSQQYQRASDAFQRLSQIYPATRDSRIFRNAQKHWTRANRALEDD